MQWLWQQRCELTVVTHLRATRRSLKQAVQLVVVRFSMALPAAACAMSGKWVPSSVGGHIHLSVLDTIVSCSVMGGTRQLPGQQP